MALDRADQRQLDFPDADAAAAERRNMISCVLALVECDLHLRVFVEMLHAATERGASVELSYRKLAGRPNGLCCSLSKARETVARARTLGIVQVIEGCNVAGGSVANKYRLDWGGVGRILRAQPLMAAREAVADDSPGMESTFHADAPTNASQPRALPEHGAAFTRHPHAARRHPTEEYLITSSSSTSNTPAPVTVPDRSVSLEKDRQQLFTSIPELTAASTRPLASLPANSLIYGAFAALKERHIGSVRTMVEWTRRQLSVAQPVVGDTEADVLIVLAVAEYALELPRADVRKSRLAVFCSMLGRRAWRRAIPYVPAAQRRLDHFRRQLADRGLDLNWRDGALSEPVTPTKESSHV